MNRIEQTFDRLGQHNEKALVGFVTAGDPTVKTSLEIIEAMLREGVDILELGVPFSDPTADGPVIQRSSARALKAGVNLKTVLQMTREIRSMSSAPIILFSYYNPILAHGVENFHADARSAGADGLLLVDLPPEESDEMTDRWPDEALSLIRLIAPTTNPARMARIVQGASGFLYLVSMTGVTGSRGIDVAEVAGTVRSLKETTALPVCVGFGVSTPEHVATLSPLAERGGDRQCL